jgi:hypothetical protein
MSTNYEQFIAANQRLMECFAGVPAEQYSAMSLSEQQNVCKNEANEVRQFLTAGQVDFRNILAERINSLNSNQE